MSCGADESVRDSFVHYHVHENGKYNEWRFGGKLGCGGKYRQDNNAVDCYPEDESPERNKVIECINEELAGI